MDFGNGAATPHPNDPAEPPPRAARSGRTGDVVRELLERRAPCAHLLLVELPPGLRLWAASRQVGACGTGGQECGRQPERCGEGDPAQQETSY